MTRVGTIDGIPARLWSLVFRSVPEPGGSCWPWPLSRDRDGYGQVSTGGKGGRMPRAHRVVYEIFVGPVPEGLTLDHTCHNEAAARGECDGGATCPHRACVNPAHLEPVTSRVNILRGLSPTAVNARKAECDNGHPLAGDNLYRGPQGGRVCRECRRAAQRAWYLRRRALGRESHESHESHERTP